MAGMIERIINIVADSKDANAKLNETTEKLKKLDDAAAKNTKSLKDNGGAMGLLGAATGGLSNYFKDAIEAAEGFVVSLKGVRGAILATGIGDFAIIILELVTKWEKWRDVIMKTNPALKALDDIQGDINAKLKETYTELFNVKSAFDQARSGAISKKEALALYNDTLGDTLGKAKSLDEAERIYNEKTPAYIKATQLRMTAQLLLGKAAEQAAKLATGETADLTFWDKIKVGVSAYVFGAAGAAEKTAEIIGDNTKEAQDAQDSLLKLAADYQKQADELSKASGLNFSKVEKAKTAVLKKEVDDRLALLKKEAEEFFRKAKESSDAYIKIQQDQKKILEENLPESPEDKAQRDLEIADNEKLSFQQRLQNLADFRASVEENEQLGADAKELFLKEAAAKEKAIQDQVDAAKEEQLRTNVDNLQNILSLGGKKLAGVAKALAIADVARSTYKSVSASIASLTEANAKAVAASPLTGGQPWVTANTVSTGLSIGSAIASGVKAIQAITSESKSLGGGGNAVGGGSGGGGGAPQAQFNIVGSSQTNQLAQTVAGAQQQPVQAYVVSTEVTSQQALDRNRMGTATFL